MYKYIVRKLHGSIHKQCRSLRLSSISRFRKLCYNNFWRMKFPYVYISFLFPHSFYRLLSFYDKLYIFEIYIMPSQTFNGRKEPIFSDQQTWTPSAEGMEKSYFSEVWCCKKTVKRSTIPPMKNSSCSTIYEKRARYVYSFGTYFFTNITFTLSSQIKTFYKILPLTLLHIIWFLCLYKNINSKNTQD